MLYLLPFLTWGAAITSAILLLALWGVGHLRRYNGAAHVGWFLAAGACQFFGSTAIVRALGLLAQTLLAVALIIRWKASD